MYIIKLLLFSVIGLILFTGCEQRTYVEPNYSTDYVPSYYDKKAQKRLPATMRSYTVMGKRYHPTVVNVGEEFSGRASWYGPNFHGKLTSNGETYDMHDFTAAHKTLPMNTVLRVTNLSNNRTVVVRINDRGPFVNSRIIDLSKSAATKIDMVGSGTAPVKLEVLGFDSRKLGYGAVSSKTINNFYVQIGAFRKLNGAKTYKKRYTNILGRYNSVIKSLNLDGEPLHRVWLSGFQSEEEARDFVARGEFKYAFITRD